MFISIIEVEVSNDKLISWKLEEEALVIFHCDERTLEITYREKDDCWKKWNKKLKEVKGSRKHKKESP